ncbi:MAG: exodeoxyribonuclease III [Lachnospiraceae bacterium]|nr:exodeoxyribonuclease III [Lachnospiraceae bacterium]
MKFISWNVNGLRACVSKGNFGEAFASLDADVFCLQETKLQEGQIELDIPSEYEQFWNYAEKKGYSGTAVFSRVKPLNVTYGMDAYKEDKEGRIICLEYDKYFLITVYTPNSKQELLRLDDRMDWEDAFLRYINDLQKKKPVIICGDMNVAHQEIDLKNPATNHRNAGFTDEEREKMTILLKDGKLIDTFRFLNPDTTGVYSWWSYRANARKNNAGWRIDYFLISESLKDSLENAGIHTDIYGSDHCPVELILKD